MTRRIGNHEIVEQLQTALESFLKDHRTLLKRNHNGLKILKE
jgi:hypothetical protein